MILLLFFHNAVAALGFNAIILHANFKNENEDEARIKKNIHNLLIFFLLLHRLSVSFKNK